MKKFTFLLVITLLACSRDNFKEIVDGSTNGSIQLSVNLGNFFIGGSGADSPWAHHYQESVDLTFSSTTSVYTKTVSFNPNDLSTFPATSLPYDTYTWSIANTGIDVTVSDVLFIYGSSTTNFVVDAPTTNLPLVLETDFALVTVSTENLSSASIQYNGETTSLTTQDGYYYGYINTNNTPYTLRIISTDSQSGSDTISNPSAYTHYNYAVTLQSFGDIGASLSLSQNFVLEDRGISTAIDDDLDGIPNSVDLCPETPSGLHVDDNGCELAPIYLDENGVTVKARPWAQIWESAVIDGVTYYVVDENALRSYVSNLGTIFDVYPLNTLVTTLVTDMNNLFYNRNDFNEDLSTWDMSNVTNVYQMFRNTSFNQDISNWDTSNITNMDGMFISTPFNQDISNWDVSKVKNMFGMFSEAISFNQDIGNWNVANVTNMSMMFSGARAFNQDIGNWNVSNVTNMVAMFQWATAFNKNIGGWNVGNVTNMSGMFIACSSFNQDISGWDVSKVTNMWAMFMGNGTNPIFNQDLSGWNVINVTNCSSFSNDTPSWTLPKPNFTNCTE